MRFISRPARFASFRQRCNSFSRASLSASSFLRGWRSTPGTTAATSHLVWLISITAMIVLSGEGSARVKTKVLRHGASVGAR